MNRLGQVVWIGESHSEAGADAAARIVERALGEVEAGRRLGASDSYAVMQAILNSSLSEELVAAYLRALAQKGETVDEIVGSATAVRTHAAPFPAAPSAIDTCGTGGDGCATFNISTTAALVVAAAGQPVVKHGNRSASGRVGSADLLEALGVPIELSVEQSAERLRRLRFAFLFAPQFHPALRNLAALRRRLKCPTIFNLIGPLCNPARPSFQVIGVCNPSTAERIASALCRLGVQRAAVVTGPGGVDELVPCDGNHVLFVSGGTIERTALSAEDAGLPNCSPADLRGGDVVTNVEILEEVLHGEQGAARDAVLMNAGLALFVAGQCASIRDGCFRCAEVIDNGAVSRLLERLQQFDVEGEEPT